MQRTRPVMLAFGCDVVFSAAQHLRASVSRLFCSSVVALYLSLAVGSQGGSAHCDRCLRSRPQNDRGKPIFSSRCFASCGRVSECGFVCAWVFSSDFCRTSLTYRLVELLRASCILPQRFSTIRLLSLNSLLIFACWLFAPCPLLAGRYSQSAAEHQR